MTAQAADLAQPEAAQALAEELLEQGIAIDFLVNNAGYGSYGLFQNSDLDAELAMMTINMTSLTVLTRRFLLQIVDRKGKIMNVAKHRWVPARPLYGGLLRHQGLRSDFHRSARI